MGDLNLTRGCVQKQIEALNSAFNSANQQIVELTKKLQMATSAATVAQTSDNALPAVDTLTTSSTRVHDLGKQLAALLKLSDEDFNADANQPIPPMEPSANGEVRCGICQAHILSDLLNLTRFLDRQSREASGRYLFANMVARVTSSRRN